MGISKCEFPILERDTAKQAIIMPARRLQRKFPKKAVFAFLGTVTDLHAEAHQSEMIGVFESITKTYPIYKTEYKGEEIC